VTPDEFLTEAERRLAGRGYAVVRMPLPGAPAVVGRQKKLRAQWLFSQVKMTVVVATVERATADGFNRFVADAWALAQQYPGGLPTGLAGVAAIPVMAANVVDPDAAALAASKPPPEWFVGHRMPGLVDLGTGAAHQFSGYIHYGAIVVPYLRKQRALVTSIVSEGASNASRVR